MIADVNLGLPMCENSINIVNLAYMQFTPTIYSTGMPTIC